MLVARVALAALFVAAPTAAWADKMFAVTPSGAAEMLFATGQQETVSALASKCIDARWTVISTSATEVVCEAPMSMGQSVLGQVLMGNSYSTPPRRFFRFNVSENRGVSRVQASGWMELQMAFGQMRRTDFSGPEFGNSIFNFMGAAGGKYPVGTTFPNHVVLGIRPQDVTLGGYKGMRVMELAPGSPAVKAGLQVGDIVTAISGKRFRKPDDYLDATAEAAAKAAYKVEFLRGDKPMSATFERAFRSPFTEVVTAARRKAEIGPVTMQPASLADELAKFAKLKADGVLSQEEFEAQKKRLLAQ